MNLLKKLLLRTFEEKEKKCKKNIKIIYWDSS